MREDLIAQENLQSSLGRPEIQISVYPLKLLCGCEPYLSQVSQPQDLQMRAFHYTLILNQKPQDRIKRSFFAPVSGPQQF